MTSKTCGMDAELETLRGVMEGNKAAQETFYVTYHAELLIILASQFDVDRPYDIEDMAQSAFCHFFEDAEAGKFFLEDPRHAFGLLVRYAKNRGVDNRRRVKVQRNHDARFRDYLMRRSQPKSPEETTEIQEEYEKLIVGLNEKQRFIVVSRVIEKQSYKKIAQNLGDGTSAEATRKNFERTVNEYFQRIKRAECNQ